MDYQQMKAKHAEELNQFPIVFAFSNSQFDEGLRKLGARKEDCVSIGSGGFMKKTDLPEFEDMYSRHNSERQESLKNADFLKGALIYELGNHEYCITYDENDAIDVLGLDMPLSQDQRKILDQAKEEYLASVVW